MLFSIQYHAWWDYMCKLPLSFMVCLFLLLLFLFVKLKGPYQTNDWYILSRFRTCFLFFVEKIKSLNFIIYLTCYNLLLLFLFFSSRVKENGNELLFMALRLPFQFPVHLWRTIQRTRYTFIFFGLYWIINLHFKFNKWTQFLNSKKERYWQRVYL